MSSQNSLVLLDFTAEWCSTCKVLDGLIKKHIRPEYEGKIEFLEIDVNERKDLAERYNILSVPTLILKEPDGRVLWRISGMVSIDEIRMRLNSSLSAEKGGQIHEQG